MEATPIMILKDLLNATRFDNVTISLSDAARNEIVIAIRVLENFNKEIDIAKEEIKYAIAKPQYAEVYLNNAIRFLDKIQSNYENKINSSK